MVVPYKGTRTPKRPPCGNTGPHGHTCTLDTGHGGRNTDHTHAQPHHPGTSIHRWPNQENPNA